MSATRPSRPSSRHPRQPLTELAPPPADLGALRARRRQARRRRRLARVDVGLGVAGAIVLLIVSPGLAITGSGRRARARRVRHLESRAAAHARAGPCTSVRTRSESSWPAWRRRWSGRNHDEGSDDEHRCYRGREPRPEQCCCQQCRQAGVRRGPGGARSRRRLGQLGCERGAGQRFRDDGCRTRERQGLARGRIPTIGYRGKDSTGMGRGRAQDPLAARAPQGMNATM